MRQPTFPSLGCAPNGSPPTNRQLSGASPFGTRREERSPKAFLSPFFDWCHSVCRHVHSLRATISRGLRRECGPCPALPIAALNRFNTHSNRWLVRTGGENESEATDRWRIVRAGCLKVACQAFDEAWGQIGTFFGNDPLMIEGARLTLANAILRVASNESRDV